MQVRYASRRTEFGNATPPKIVRKIAALAAEVPADQAVVELGVYLGKTTIRMAQATRAGRGAHVWGIDAWDLIGNTYGPPFIKPQTRDAAYQNIKTYGLADQVTLIRGFSTEQARCWSGPPIGLLFIDADHSYEGARGDVHAWASHLAPDAVIAFDDYGHPDWPGVKQAADDLVSEGMLESLQIFHSRLAVTRLRERRA